LNKGFAEISKEDLKKLLSVPEGIEIKDIIHLVDPNKDIYIINIEGRWVSKGQSFWIDDKGVWRNV
jgi:hypothetical protein